SRTRSVSSARHRADTVTPSRSARTFRLAPRESRRSARSWDVYAAVPRVSMEAVKSASPSRPGGSYTAPARRYPRTVTKDRKSTRLNSSHVKISYAVFCLKKKKRVAGGEEGRHQRGQSAAPADPLTPDSTQATQPRPCSASQ